MTADKLLIATHNKGKLAELRELLRDAPFELLSLTDIGIDLDVDETGDTLEENAVLKATTYARLAGIRALADDSGLEVDALGGAPGVHSARYVGPGATDADRIEKMLGNLAVHPQPWTARFRCVIAIATPDGDFELHDGACEGVITSTPARRKRLRLRPGVPAARAKPHNVGVVRCRKERHQP